MTGGQASDLPLAWEVRGSGPPLVMVHGFGASRFTWRRWVPILERRHTVYLVDLKGFGEAPRPRDGRYSPLDQATLLVEWLRRMDLREVTLVGHSLGGGIVLSAALTLEADPVPRVRGVVVISGAAYPQQIPKYIGLARLPIIPALGLRLVPSRFLLAKVLREISHADHEVTPEEVEGYAAPLDRPGTRYAILQAARQGSPPGVEDVVRRYPELRLPVLLLWGREDPVVPLSAARRLLDELPAARLVILDHCGHLPQEERPEEGIEALLSFLEGLGGGDVPGMTGLSQRRSAP